MSDHDDEIQDLVEYLKEVDVSSLVRKGFTIDRNRYSPTSTGSLSVIRSDELRSSYSSRMSTTPEAAQSSNHSQQSNLVNTNTFQSGSSGTGSSQPGRAMGNSHLTSQSRLLQSNSNSTAHTSTNQPITGGSTAPTTNQGSSSMQPQQVQLTNVGNTQSYTNEKHSQDNFFKSDPTASTTVPPAESSIPGSSVNSTTDTTNQSQSHHNAPTAVLSGRGRAADENLDPQSDPSSYTDLSNASKPHPLTSTVLPASTASAQTSSGTPAVNSNTSFNTTSSRKARLRSKKDQKAEIAVEVRRYHLMINSGKVQDALQQFKTRIQNPEQSEGVLVYNAQLCTHLAGVLLNEKRPMNAIEVLQEGLKLYESGRLVADNHDNLDALWHLHDQLAVAYSANDDSANEAFHYEKAIEILDGYDTHPERYYHMMNNLGNCYKSLKKHGKARSMLERANAEMSKIYPLLSDGRLNDRLQKAINSLASLYKSTDEVDLAIEKYELLVDAIEKQNPNVEPLARLWEAKLNLAQLYEKKGRREDARRIKASMEDARGNDQEDDGIDRPAQYWNSQCVLYIERGIFAQKQKDHKLAVDSYERAYKAYMKAPLQVEGDEKTQETLAKIHNNMGNSYQALRDFPRAVRNLREGLAIREKLNGGAVPNKELASSYFNLANLLMVMDQENTIKESIELYEKTIEIYIKLNAEHIPKLAKWLARSYKHLASIYQGKKLYHKAIEFFNKAKQLYETILEHNIDDYQGMCNNLGNAYESIEDYDKAQQMIKFSLQLCDRLIEKQPHDVSLQNRKAACLNNLGIAYKGARQFNESREYLRTCYELRLKLINDFADQEARDDIAGTCQNLGNTYNDEKNYEKAAEWLEKAVEFCDKFGMSSQSARVALSVIYEKMGLLWKALEIVK